MWVKNVFNTATEATKRRRPTRWSASDSSLHLEPLEDRRMLSFSPAVDYPVGENPLAIVAADFNSDGRLDLATANSTLSILLGNADGTFQAAQTTDSPATSLAVGDFNADGKLDLAATDGASVRVLLGNGNGTFQAPTSIDIGSIPQSVAVGDFNSDGKLDLGVTSNVYYPGSWGYYGWYPGYYQGRANVLLGTGGGSFAAPNIASLGYGFHTSASLADLNGDGKLDFATVNSDYGNVLVLPGNGTGVLGAPNYFSSAYASRSVAAGDVNGDGKRLGAGRAVRLRGVVKDPPDFCHGWRADCRAARRAEVWHRSRGLAPWSNNRRARVSDRDRGDLRRATSGRDSLP